MGGSYSRRLGLGGAGINKLATFLDELWAAIQGGRSQGDAWYVDGTNGNDGQSGKSWSRAVATIGQARTLSSAGDKIIIAPGTYTQTAAAQPLTPKAQQTYIADVVSPGEPSVIITGAAEANLVEVDVDDVAFVGITFQADADGVAKLVDVADAASVTGLTFLHCVFDANGKATVVGISAVDGTFTCTGLYVTGCAFRDCNTGIDVGVLGMPYATIRDNVFDMIDAGGGDVGIALADTSAAATGYGFVIKENDFIGPPDAGADSVGITVAGTENTTAIGIIRGNFFAYCGASSVTIDKISQAMINNYYGDVATGGTLVDPGT